jgi:hypothetical protein
VIWWHFLKFINQWCEAVKSSKDSSFAFSSTHHRISLSCTGRASALVCSNLS